MTKAGFVSDRALSHQYELLEILQIINNTTELGMLQWGFFTPVNKLAATLVLCDRVSVCRPEFTITCTMCIKSDGTDHTFYNVRSDTHQIVRHCLVSHFSHRHVISEIWLLLHCAVTRHLVLYETEHMLSVNNCSICCPTELNGGFFSVRKQKDRYWYPAERCITQTNAASLIQNSPTWVNKRFQ